MIKNLYLGCDLNWAAHKKIVAISIMPQRFHEAQMTGFLSVQRRKWKYMQWFVDHYGAY